MDQIYQLSNFTTNVTTVDGIDLSDVEHPIIVADSNVKPVLEQLLVHPLAQYPVFWLDATEENKSPDILKNIYRFMNRHQAHRDSTVVGIGGGITTDIAGFIGATYKRGCKLQLVPTTFVGMIDASIGGKAAINFDGIKNCVGTFYPAERVIVCPAFLDTVPAEVLMEGWAEAIKVALIQPSDLLNQMQQDKPDLKAIIPGAIDVKLSLCVRDLHDRAERRLLNFGHTFAHVIEAISGYGISHGMAVGLGMRAAVSLSVSKGLLSAETAQQINRLFHRFAIPEKKVVCTKERLLADGAGILKQDKKNNGQLTLILLTDIQQAVVDTSSDEAMVLRHLAPFITEEE